ncbi:phospholipase effector Tle1 domain-containing protein [Undibacterium sp. Ren11W]|uniref:T6SS phospholipase effector Tle1-like catalytic domain-containing protein n=1 Tax=Undibacterium sp. Ren11W TaxID=3413045 RepID=UPI003BEF6B1F
MSTQALCAANRDVDNEAPDKRQDCSAVVHLAYFFDGTGNNRDADKELKKWSNVARLYDSARDEEKNAIYRIYISGVGTRFNGEMGWVKSAWTWMQDGALGNGFGAGGDIRLDEGEDQMNFALRNALLVNASKANNEVKKIAEENQDKGFKKLNEVLGEYRLIKCINISIFGFSRGAALARAFTNRLLKQCKPDGCDGLTLDGIPVRLVFLGVFDTVASFGLPRKNLTLPWGVRDLIVDDAVWRCVHYVAAHELRHSFPVDLIRRQGKYSERMLEKVYPGVHSDIGGGYEVDKQARTDNLARIPLGDMSNDAFDCGVRLFNLAQLKSDYFPIFKRFEVEESTRKAYDLYCGTVGAAGGSIESQVQKHMAAYYSYRGSLERKKCSSESRANNAMRVAKADAELKAAKKQADAWPDYDPEFGPRSAENKAAIANYQQAKEQHDQVKKEQHRLDVAEEDIAKEAKAMELAVKNGHDMQMWYGALRYSYPAQAWMVSAWKTDASQEMCDFFERYVHDSRTDFLSGKEPSSYFANRGIEESTEKVLKPGQVSKSDNSKEKPAACMATTPLAKPAEVTPQAEPAKEMVTE